MSNDLEAIKARLALVPDDLGAMGWEDLPVVNELHQHAPADLRWLVAEVIALRAEVERLNSRHKEHRATFIEALRGDAP